MSIDKQVLLYALDEAWNALDHELELLNEDKFAEDHDLEATRESLDLLERLTDAIASKPALADQILEALKPS